MKRWLRRVPGLRSGVYLGIEMRRLLRPGPADVADWDDAFQLRVDPWSYESPSQRERYARSMRLLETAGPRFVRCLEIGCAEGRFTEMLAARCQVLEAVDVSPTAVERARARCRRFANVRFGTFDLMKGSLDGRFDLITAMDVIECLPGPRSVRVARDRIVQLLAPAGHLLLTTTLQHPVVERAWWGRLILRGSHINRHFSDDKRLTLVSEDATGTHVLSLYSRNNEGAER